jgi:23S rRNA (cytosine1962-C5)-methyltransferase
VSASDVSGFSERQPSKHSPSTLRPTIREVLSALGFRAIQRGTMKDIELPETLVRSLAAGHPWVYRDHVGRFQAPSGTWVRVRAGSYVAYGLWDAESQIAVRLFSTQGPVDQAWVTARVKEAWELRQHIRDKGCTGYRLIFGEADQLPGIVVDLYGAHGILVTYSKALGPIVPLVSEAVVRIAGLETLSRRHKEDTGTVLRPIHGGMPPEKILVYELGMRLWANVHHGQKTGLFFDHRDNRRFVHSVALGKSVLNLFCYTGGFSVAAALGGATSVTSVDSAAPAVAAARDNFSENGLGSVPHEALVEDVFSYLPRVVGQAQRFDLVVCDPPSFAKSRDQLRAAEKAYKNLMALALSVTAPGGYCCLASCTSQVGPEAFKRLIGEAARKARVRFQVVRDVGQPSDHPVQIGHEEGRYLKFVAGRVLARC